MQRCRSRDPDNMKYTKAHKQKTNGVGGGQILNIRYFFPKIKTEGWQLLLDRDKISLSLSLSLSSDYLDEESCDIAIENKRI